MAPNWVEPALHRIAELMRGTRFRVSNEAELQRAVEALLGQAGIPYRREFELSQKDRPDFFVLEQPTTESTYVVRENQVGIVLELKMNGGLSEVTRQLHRYSTYTAVAALLLVSTRSQLCRQPDEMMGKPVRCIAVRSGLVMV